MVFTSGNRKMCIRDRGKIEGVSDRKLSAVFQEDRLCENLSAASNIRLVCTETVSYTHLQLVKFLKDLQADGQI